MMKDAENLAAILVLGLVALVSIYWKVDAGPAYNVDTDDPVLVKGRSSRDETYPPYRCLKFPEEAGSPARQGL